MQKFEVMARLTLYPKKIIEADSEEDAKHIYEQILLNTDTEFNFNFQFISSVKIDTESIENDKKI